MWSLANTLQSASKNLQSFNLDALQEDETSASSQEGIKKNSALASGVKGSKLDFTNEGGHDEQLGVNGGDEIGGEEDEGEEEERDDEEVDFGGGESVLNPEHPVRVEVKEEVKEEMEEEVKEAKEGEEGEGRESEEKRLASLVASPPSDVSLLQRQLSSCSEQLVLLSRENQKLQKQNSTMTAAAKSHAKLTSEHADLRANHGRLREAHKVLKSKASKVVDELKGTRSQLEAAAEGKARQGVECMEIRNTCKALKERNANLQRENEDSAETISKMAADLTVLREAAKKTKAESEVKGRDFTDELKTYKEKALKALQQSNERVTALTKENASLKELNEGYKRDAEDARDEKDKAESSVSGLRSQISTLTSSLEASKAELEATLGKASRSEMEAEALREEVERTEGERRKAEEENVKLTNIVEAARTTAAIAEKETRGLEEKVKALETSLENARSSAPPPTSPPTGTTAATEAPTSSPPTNNSQTNQTTSEPLIYALSKASELSVATSEITRLSSLLADLSDDLTVSREDCSSLSQELTQAKMEIERASRMGGGDGDNVNVEYLKNVLLQYLTSQTVGEKRRLLPVLATVLSLTPAERIKAEKSLESNKGI
ncbi:hypothetical protein TrCOL_g1409, partial [Triparma columacea]